MLHSVKLEGITVGFMWVYNKKAFALQRFIQPNVCLCTWWCYIWYYFRFPLVVFKCGCAMFAEAIRKCMWVPSSFLLLGKLFICTRLLVLGSSYSSMKRYLAPPDFVFSFLSHLNVWSYAEEKGTQYTLAITCNHSVILPAEMGAAGSFPKGRCKGICIW